MMTTKSASGLGSKEVVIAILALVGTAAILVSTSRYGAGVSPDSVEYIGAARSILAGAGVTSYTGAPLVKQPPLFPGVLALAAWLLAQDPSTVASIVNAVAFGVIIFLGGVLAQRLLSGSRSLAVTAAVAILVSVPLVKGATWALSEPLFILFAVASLLLADAYLESGEVGPLIGLSCSVALACLTRYIGAALILWGLLVVLTLRRERLRSRLVHLGIFVLVSGLPIGLWLLRNYSVSGTLMGPRAPSPQSLPENLQLLYGVVMDWYVPSLIYDKRPALVVFGLAAMIAAALLARRRRPDVASLRRRPAVGAIVLLLMVYATALVGSATITNLDEINDRLLSPMYVPGTLLLFTLPHLWSEAYGGAGWRRILTAALIIGPALWLAYPAKGTVRVLQNQLEKGSGFSAQAWQESQTVRYLTEHDLDCAIYSNGADALYVLADLHVSPVPRKKSGAQVVARVADLADAWPPEGRACVVWFDNINRPYLFNPDELRSATRLERFIRLSDGAIYVISKS